jgi:hypothetical protein
VLVAVRAIISQRAREEQPVETETVEQVEGQPGEDGGSEALRDLVVRAYPEVVPELLQGETVEEMLASLPAAQAAWQRVAEQSRPSGPQPVPSGGGTSRAFPLDIGAMSSGLKIREGLRRRG